jgi:hypothetical protein
MAPYPHIACTVLKFAVLNGDLLLSLNLKFSLEHGHKEKFSLRDQ